MRIQILILGFKGLRVIFVTPNLIKIQRKIFFLKFTFVPSTKRKFFFFFSYFHYVCARDVEQ